jgi:hypothetical protein
MKINYTFSKPAFALTPLMLAAVVCGLGGARLLADSTKNPVSKIYVAEVKGKADLTTSDSVTALDNKTVFNADGTVVQTAEKSDDSMVYSNGTGIYLDASTRIEVKKFLQEPFTPNRTDMDLEPSVSQTNAVVPKGAIGLCTSKLIAGTSMVYSTPQCSMSIRGKKLVIEVSDTQTRISVVEGDITVHANGDGGAAGTILHGGQEIIIKSDSTGKCTITKVGAIPDDHKKYVDNMASMACIAKREVFFEIAKREDQTDSIIPVEALPSNKPTDFTESPSRLP